MNAASVRKNLEFAASKFLAETLIDIPEDDDDLNAEEQETLEETLVDQATAARTIAELEQEIIILEGLEQQAKAVVVSGQDRKWDELSRILQNEPAMRDAGGRLRKIIIFSEHRDTLNYLHQKIAGVLGNATPSSPSTVAPTGTSVVVYRHCSGLTRMFAFLLPPTPPAKALTFRTPT